MYPATIFEPKIREVGGEPLEGSGFDHGGSSPTRRPGGQAPVAVLPSSMREVRPQLLRPCSLAPPERAPP